MSKFSDTEKLEAVLRVVEDGMGCKSSAKIMGVHHSVVADWVARYRKFGVEGILMKHGTYDGEFKVYVIEYMHNNHLSLRQTAAEFGIPCKETVSKWERIYYEEGPQGLYRENRGRKSKMSFGNQKNKKISKKTEEDLIAEVQRLRMENDYLKKLQALVQERIARENGKESEQ